MTTMPNRFDSPDGQTHSVGDGCEPEHGADVVDLVEQLAALSHEQWSGWAEWMFDKWDRRHASGESFRDRWVRQMYTTYADLSQTEKESDRVEARRMLGVVQPDLDALRAQLAAALAVVEAARAYRATHRCNTHFSHDCQEKLALIAALDQLPRTAPPPQEDQ